MTPEAQIARVKEALSLPGGASSDFDLNPGMVLPEGRKLKAAGVLVPLLAGPAGLDVVLTKRSTRLRHHPGQVAFPGGKQDPGDATPADAALREAEEEIGLPRGRVELIGELPSHETVTSFVIHPVIGLIDGDFTPVPEAGEVAEVFRVPLSHLADSTRFRVESRFWQGRRRAYYTVPYGPYYIWGATARILRGLAERVAQCA